MVAEVREVAQSVNALHRAHAGQNLVIEDYIAIGASNILIVYSLVVRQ